MAALDGHYHGATYPETFAAECHPGSVKGPPYHVLTIGPVVCFLTEGQLHEIHQTIDSALGAGQVARLMRPVDPATVALVGGS